jgi:hypothetical protein
MCPSTVEWSLYLLTLRTEVESTSRYSITTRSHRELVDYALLQQSAQEFREVCLGMVLR